MNVLLRIAVVFVVLISAALLCFALIIDEDVHMDQQARKARSSLQELGTAMLAYANDNGGYLPNADSWCDTLMKYDRSISRDTFHNPATPRVRPEPVECNFAFNDKLSGKHIESVSEDTILLFQADGPWNLSGNEELLNTRYHEHQFIYLLHYNQDISLYWFRESIITYGKW